MNAATKFLLALLLAPMLAIAAEGHIKLDHAPGNDRDVISLQRGAQVFVNYCLNCHSANYMRYNRLQDLGLNEQQIRDNLVFTSAKVGDLMKIAMDPNDSKEWFGAPPPDLTVIARSRSSPSGPGTDWLYTYLRSFYRDASRPSGWNNTVYPNVGMPHVLWEMQGEQVLKETKVQAEGYMKTEMNLAMDKPGKMTPLEYERMVSDLVNYMGYMAEPARHDRTTIGIYALLFLGLLFILAFMLKKEFWKDVH
jgi:ubiquinol-cytochrome c reductase cytochrome c1 subunit